VDGRTLLRISSAAKRGFLLGVSILYRRGGRASKAAHRCFQPNAWIRIDAAGRVTIRVDRSEMGQGVMTALAMLVAEELDIELSSVAVEFATGLPEYASPLFGLQITSASSSIRDGWQRFRHAGANARAMLVDAAARLWKVDPSSCRTDAGHVLHPESGRSISYGALSTLAATARRDNVDLKPARDFRLIGRATKQLGATNMVTGRAVFGADIRLPGMYTAVIARPPEIGATLIGLDEQDALRSPGVRFVVQMESGVAVVADDFWHACKGREVLKLQWQKSTGSPQRDMEVVRRTFRHIAREGPACVVRALGSYSAARERAVRVISAEYESAYQAHATMEPMNCTAHVTDHGCEVWAPTQNPDGTRLVAADITRLPLDSIRVHVTFLGGGFGRRQETDFVIEAVRLSQRLKKPVKVMWTRRDDMQHDYYRPAAFAKVEAALDAQNKVIGLHCRLVSTSVWKRSAQQYADLLYLRSLPPWARKAGNVVAQEIIKLTYDPNIAEAAEEVCYAFPSMTVDYGEYDPGIPAGPWRSVGYYPAVFAIESFVDEIAASIGEDPYALRCSLLQAQPRLLRVLQTVGRQVDWPGKMPTGRGLGLACYRSLGTFVAMVAEVEKCSKSAARVARMICAIDCGAVVNPDTVRAQVEGGIVFGLGAGLKHAITIRQGRVEQSDFDNYPLLRFDEMPDVRVNLISSDAAPTGVGEAATPGVGPAVCNAIYAATGQRFRQLPIDVASQLGR
jgi:isoquinoline 1-oxidoreductase subunit beta